MKLFSFTLIICFATLFSDTKGNFINDVRDKFGNSDKSYSVKTVTKDTENSESNEKKSKKEKKKGGYR